VRQGRKRDFRGFTRGLRFRLTVGSALFFAVFLVGVAALFRASLANSLNSQEHDVLNERWGAVKAYLRIDKNGELGRNEAYWYYDDQDPDESRIVLAIKQVYLIADENGTIIPDHKLNQPAVSSVYERLGIDDPAVIRKRVQQALAAAVRPNRTGGMTFWDERSAPDGTPYLIRSGIAFDEAHLQEGKSLPYYVSIGASIRPYQNVLSGVTWLYIAVVPAGLILGLFLGWVMTGRALTPVLEVAQAAQRISGSNLSLRIPTRKTGDELDYLILTFNRMIERLEASFRQMKQFSADVSHELRTPITGMRGQLEVALFTAKTTDQYREAMFNALQDIDRLSQLVRALLLLSQAESGQLVLQKARLDLGRVAGDLVEQFQIPAEAAGVRLTANLAAGCAVEGDRVQIERMINNLLSNAIKFTPEGGEVRVAVMPDERFVNLVVEDTGRGIPTEHLPRIFDRFYRVPGSGGAPGDEQGLGLGLSFVAWIAKAHRGRVDVNSTPGKGTRFTVWLPAAGAGVDTMELAGQPAARIMNEL
jgi:heavy metal sensor kinase